MEMSSDADRLNDAKLNANTMAYYTFYATMAAFLLSDMVQSINYRKLFKILFLAMIPISFVAIVTASRQVLIIQIPLICF